MADRSGSPVFTYDGPVYVRPVSRGVLLLDDPHGLHVEDAVPDGYYRMSVSFTPIPRPAGDDS